MKRRTFIRGLALATSATLIGIKAAQKPAINPAWINAPYEAYFLFGSDAFKPLRPIDLQYRGITFGIDPDPLRIIMH